ncbi:unnamed protein product [Prunus armeniaca]|uniref:Uncharacterized protein n=1 Tax=Prunus armeniaca TaxID=36596 RepID=A0A6J5U9U9_PRUAR|nr:unnamed protein product [Prunus armeniaca]
MRSLFLPDRLSNPEISIIQNKDLVVQYVPTDEQVADILTKGLIFPFLSPLAAIRPYPRT